MFKLIWRTGLVSLCLFYSSGIARAEDQGAVLDSVYGLTTVRDLSTTNGDVLAMTLNDRVLIYSLFPTRLIKEVPLQVNGYASVLTESGNLFVLGDDPEVSTSKEAGSGGSIQFYRDVLKQTDFTNPGVIPLDTTPFTELMLTDDGDIYASSPTRLSVLKASEDLFLGFLNGGALLLDNLFLQCGVANRFSVFKAGDQTLYVAASAAAKVLELGPLALNEREAKKTECFTPVSGVLTRSVKTLASVRGNALAFELVDSANFLGKPDEFILDKGVLSFDVASGELTFVPIELFAGFTSFVRTESVSVNLAGRLGSLVGGSDVSILSSDPSANSILVSGVGSPTIHRIAWTGDNFAYHGRFELNSPVQSIRYDENGDQFLIATGDAAEQQVLVLRNPSAIEPFARLPAARALVEQLQSSINTASEESTLKDDGILGRETRNAINGLADRYGTSIPNDTKQNLNALFPLEPAYR